MSFTEKIEETLQKKAGPLKVWQWGAAGVGGLAVMVILRGGGGAGTVAAQAATPITPGDTIPQPSDFGISGPGNYGTPMPLPGLPAPVIFGAPPIVTSVGVPTAPAAPVAFSPAVAAPAPSADLSGSFDPAPHDPLSPPGAPGVPAPVPAPAPAAPPAAPPGSKPPISAGPVIIEGPGPAGPPPAPSKPPLQAALDLVDRLRQIGAPAPALVTVGTPSNPQTYGAATVTAPSGLTGIPTGAPLQVVDVNGTPTIIGLSDAAVAAQRVLSAPVLSQSPTLVGAAAGGGSIYSSPTVGGTDVLVKPGALPPPPGGGGYNG